MLSVSQQAVGENLLISTSSWTPQTMWAKMAFREPSSMSTIWFPHLPRTERALESSRSVIESIPWSTWASILTTVKYRPPWSGSHSKGGNPTPGMRYGICGAKPLYQELHGERLRTSPSWLPTVTRGTPKRSFRRPEMHRIPGCTCMQYIPANQLTLTSCRLSPVILWTTSSSPWTHIMSWYTPRTCWDHSSVKVSTGTYGFYIIFIGMKVFSKPRIKPTLFFLEYSTYWPSSDQLLT